VHACVCACACVCVRACVSVCVFGTQDWGCDVHIGRKRGACHGAVPPGAPWLDDHNLVCGWGGSVGALCMCALPCKRSLSYTTLPCYLVCQGCKSRVQQVRGRLGLQGARQALRPCAGCGLQQGVSTGPSSLAGRTCTLAAPLPGSCPCCVADSVLLACSAESKTPLCVSHSLRRACARRPPPWCCTS